MKEDESIVEMSERDNEYLSEQTLAPYLRTSIASTSEPDGNDSSPTQKSAAATSTSKDEADAAAGLQQRVSSFGNLFQSKTSPSRNQIRSDHARIPQHSIGQTSRGPPTPVIPDWRLKERMRTVACGLVLALNIEIPPPDVVRPNPCAVLTSWIDPTDRTKRTRTQAGELIAERLEQQYSQWQRNLKFRRMIDPTFEQMKSLCERLRRDAKNDRLLLHFNGHGVPRPTDVGELWTVDSNKTEYIPIAMEDIKQWLGSPSMIVLDCSNAAALIPYFCNVDLPPGTSLDEIAGQWVKDIIILCPCGQNEILPMHPDYPADLFTSCLTTPIPMALRWFILNNPALGLTPEMIDLIPGNVSERKTPLGELNWILTSVLDSIAWSILPKPLFQILFRQDLMVASMFRNFLLADRILRGFRCTPQTVPPMPADASKHPLWYDWDLTCETFLFQLKQAGVFDALTETSPESLIPLNADDEPKQVDKDIVISLPFFTEHLIAFEHWLDYSRIYKYTQQTEDVESPEQLPVVFQILLGQKHRVWALKLFKRFFELGPWAVNLSLSLGIFPYVNKLLIPPEYRSLLIPIWASILSFDPSCRADLLNTKGSIAAFCEPFMFAGNLSSKQQVNESAAERITAAFVLAVTCYGYPAGQSECFRGTLHLTCLALLSSYEQGENHQQDLDLVEAHLPAYFRLWLCICLANMVKDNAPIQTEVYAAGVCKRLKPRLRDRNPQVRAAVAYAAGCLIGSPQRRLSSAQDLASSSLRMSHQSLLSPIGRISEEPTLMNITQLQLGGGANILKTDSQQGNTSSWSQQIPFGGQKYMSPTGFMVGSGSFVPPQSQGNPQLANFMFLSAKQQESPQSPETRRSSIVDDRQTFERDMTAMEIANQALLDSSVIVRYEAAVALGISVQKYMDVFLVIASETFDDLSIVQMPATLRAADQEFFRIVWGHLRSLQRDDPFPSVKRAIADIVTVVHENLWRLRENPGSGKMVESGPLHDEKVAHVIACDSMNRKGQDMRRVVSEVAGKGIKSMEESAVFSKRSVHSDDLAFEVSPYKIPESKFYAWQRQEFDTSFLYQSGGESLDLLCPHGAAKAYQMRRNSQIKLLGKKLSLHFEPIAPVQRPEDHYPKHTPRREQDEKLEEARAREVAALKAELTFSTNAPLRNQGVQRTCLVNFHPFEDFLITCSNPGTISIWETAKCRRLRCFSNGNSKESRITSSRWVNESTKSLFLTGCNDGTVRLWSNLIDELGEDPFEFPIMTSAFRAVPMNREGSGGLVVAWHQHRGLLLAGGNSQHLHCWDAEQQKELQKIKTSSDACVTCLTTAWGGNLEDYAGRSSSAVGIGPNTVIAGQSDGCIKVFDLRTLENVAEPTCFSEHKNWVVTAAFARHAGQNALYTGTVAGEIKTWDLRMRKCIRTMDIQRSLMTSMDVHRQIPIVATGAQQFLKVASLDGETIQVIRHFGNKANRRSVGPVTCLAFHPTKPMLASGATDEYIGLYKLSPL